MKRHHISIFLWQLVAIVTFSRVPTYGIPPFLWEYRGGRINQWQTLLNWLQWLDDLR